MDFNRANSPVDQVVEGRPIAGADSERLATLDGVRGLAIALILAYHLIPVKPDGGREFALVEAVLNSAWAGVDLFFVLSGFLITGILVDSKAKQHYWRNFLARRFLRIFPLYYGFLFVLFAAAALAASRGCIQCPTLLGNQMWFWTYTTNVLVVRDGWNALPFNTAPLWSLAAEVQFYLLWPALVLLTSVRGLAGVCLALVLLSPVARLALDLAGTPYRVSYVLSILRLDAFAVGALVALAVRSPTWDAQLRRFAVVVGAAAFATVGTLLVAFNGLERSDRLVQTLGYSAIALGFGALIAWAVRAPDQALSARLFRSAVMTRLGLYSYGLYVFHYPLLYATKATGIDAPVVGNLLGNDSLGTAVYVLGLFGLSLTVAALSWHLYEKPIMRLKSRFTYRLEPRAACQTAP